MTYSWDRTGWFAAMDEDAPPDMPWQPCLQLPGLCPSFEMWFATEAACEAYIREEILPAALRMYDDAA